MQIQSNVLRFLTVEKMIHAYASNTIPIYFGNDKILLDGFNPKSFINCHEYESLDDIVNRIIEIDKNDELFKEIVSEPIFLENVLPNYFNHNYILNFFEKIITNQNFYVDISTKKSIENSSNIKIESVYTFTDTEKKINKEERNQFNNLNELAVVSLFFNYPYDKMPLIYENTKKYIGEENFFIARFDGLPLDSSYYEKLYRYKLFYLLPYIKENILNKYKYMIFVDATDTNFYKNPTDIIEVFKSFNKSIVFCGEKPPVQ
jgi:hypothetical protein